MALTIDQARKHIRAQVSYTPRGDAKPEYGLITEVRGPYVFVLFHGDRIAKACRPGALTLVP